MAAGPYARGDKWQVKWREGGRGAGWQGEVFDAEHEAHVFKHLVELAGNRWPRDEAGSLWIKGHGFPEAPEVEPGTPFLPYASKRIRALLQSGRIGPDMSIRYTRYAQTIAGSLAVAPTLMEQVQSDPMLSAQTATIPLLARPLLLSLVGDLTDEEVAERAKEAVVEDLDADAIRAWIFWMRVRAKRPDNTGPGLSWKTIANYHGFLHGVLEQAFYEDLIRRNPTKITSREIGKEVVVKKVILTPEHFGLIYANMAADQKDLCEAAVGTGARFGELTAACVRHWRPEEGLLRVEEAWKRGLPGQGFYRGTPKTAAGIRDVYVSDRVAALLDRHAKGKGPDDLLFTAIRGGRVRQNVFSEERWIPAVEKAMQQGLPTRPRFHDLRHTHVSWLRRTGLGNDVIKTMVGHSDEAMTEQYGEIPKEIRQAAVAVIDQHLAHV